MVAATVSTPYYITTTPATSQTSTSSVVNTASTATPDTPVNHSSSGTDITLLCYQLASCIAIQ